MSNTVYIRADGNSKIGLGHIYRCVALAQMLTEYFEISFFCKVIPKELEIEILKLSFGVKIIKDESDFFELINKDHIVVIDHYEYDANYQKKIKKKAFKLVCIDDLCHKKTCADLVINPAPGVKPTDYIGQSYTRFALGCDFSLLRPVFLEAAREVRTTRPRKKILICFGGADMLNLTQRALSAVLENKQFNDIIVVVGSAYKFQQQLENLILHHENIKLYHSINGSQMQELMLSSHTAIIPASGILYEAIACGCKIVFGYYIDNQKAIYEGFKQLNLFYDSNKFEDISYVLGKMNQNMKVNQEQLIDGFSSTRILNYFRKF